MNGKAEKEWIELFFFVFPLWIVEGEEMMKREWTDRPTVISRLPISLGRRRGTRSSIVTNFTSLGFPPPRAYGKLL